MRERKVVIDSCHRVQLVISYATSNNEIYECFIIQPQETRKEIIDANAKQFSS